MPEQRSEILRGSIQKTFGERADETRLDSAPTRPRATPMPRTEPLDTAKDKTMPADTGQTLKEPIATGLQMNMEQGSRVEAVPLPETAPVLRKTEKMDAAQEFMGENRRAAVPVMPQNKTSTVGTALSDIAGRELKPSCLSVPDAPQLCSRKIPQTPRNTEIKKPERGRKRAGKSKF